MCWAESRFSGAFGGPGAGQAAKLVNNVMSLVNTAVATEALRLAESLGIDPERMRALAMAPAAMEGHEAALALAKTLGRVPEYVDACQEMAERAIASGDVDLGRRLLARLHRLPVTIAVTVASGGHRTTLARRRVTIRRS